MREIARKSNQCTKSLQIDCCIEYSTMNCTITHNSLVAYWSQCRRGRRTCEGCPHAPSLDWSRSRHVPTRDSRNRQSGHWRSDACPPSTAEERSRRHIWLRCSSMAVHSTGLLNQIQNWLFWLSNFKHNLLLSRLGGHLETSSLEPRPLSVTSLPSECPEVSVNMTSFENVGLLVFGKGGNAFVC
jgi:hypothetical protein